MPPPPSVLLSQGPDRVTVDEINPHQNATYCSYMFPLNGTYGPFVEDGTKGTDKYISKTQLEVCRGWRGEDIFAPSHPHAPGRGGSQYNFRTSHPSPCRDGLLRSSKRPARWSRTSAPTASAEAARSTSSPPSAIPLILRGTASRPSLSGLHSGTRGTTSGGVRSLCLSDIDET